MATLPNRVDSTILSKYLTPGEPAVVVKLIGVGNLAPYDFRDKGTRSYVFRYDQKYSGHIIRIPLSLWQDKNGQMAHDIMDQRHLSHSMVVLLEVPTPAAAPISPPQAAEKAVESPVLDGTPSAPATTSDEMGATDTDSDARNVVGPGAEPTVAPASEQEEQPTCHTEDEQDEAERLYRESLPAAQESPVLSTEDTPTVVHSTYSIICQQAYDLVETPKRIKALAALLGIEESGLRSAIDYPDSKVELAHAGWVRRKA